MVDLPYIGKMGGSHMLNWTLDKDQIHIHTYSHIPGDQVLINTNEVEKAKEKYEKKTFFGKLLAGIAKDQLYSHTVIPVVMHGRLSTHDLGLEDSKTVLFHKVDKVKEGYKVYFQKKSGMANLNSSFISGTPIDYHYSQLNEALPRAPEYDKDLLEYSTVEFKGKGLLGLKDIKPVLITKSAIFTYEDRKGYITKTETEDTEILGDDSRLQDYQFIRDATETYDGNTFAWFMKKKDFSKYKLAIVSKSGEFKVIPFEFATARKLQTQNKAVYDKDLHLKGVLHTFGYHRKGKKQRDIYPENTFDIIYMDTSGNIKLQTKATHGTLKKYRRVITPIVVIDKGNGQLEFINNHILSILKGNYEKFTLDANGAISVSFSQNNSENKGDELYNYYDYLTDFNRIYKIGDRYFIQKTISEQVSIQKNLGQGQTATVKKPNDVAINLTMLDMDWKPLSFISMPVASNPVEHLQWQTIVSTDDLIVKLAHKGRIYYMYKLQQTANGPKMTIKEIASPYNKKATKQLYFGSYALDYALVDKEQSVFYIMHQFYDTKTYGEKVLDKIGITKVSYP